MVEESAKEGLDLAKPISFRLQGDIAQYNMHVVAASMRKGHEQEHGAAMQYVVSGKSITGQLIGFYSGSAYSGVISPPGKLFHVHMVDASESISAHVDSYSVTRQSVFLLPKKLADAVGK